MSSITDETIVLVNQVTGPVFSDLVNEFSQQELDIILITGNIDGSIKKNSNVKIVLGPKYNKNTTFLRLITWLSFTVFTFIYLFVRQRAKMILFVSNPPLLFFVGYVLNKIKRQPYSLLVYDLYPEILQSASIASTNLVFKLWKRLNTRVLKSAHTVITISDNMKVAIKEYGSQLQVHVVPTWVDTDIFTPNLEVPNYLADLTGWSDRFFILYSGNLGRSHKIKNLLDYIRKKRNDDRFGFIFIGGGEGWSNIYEFQKKHKLRNLFVNEYIPFKDLPASLSSADLSIVSYGQNTESYMVPSKAYFYLASGSPILVLADSKNDLSALIEAYGIGVEVLNDNFSSLDRYLERLCDPLDSLMLDRENSRNLACDYYGKQNAKDIVELISGA